MNPINMAKGLLDELDNAVRSEAHDLQADIRRQLEQLAPEVKKAVGELRGLVDPKTIELSDGSTVPTTAVTDIQAVGARLDEVLSASGGKRTAKAAAAPQTATPPAAK